MKTTLVAVGIMAGCISVSALPLPRKSATRSLRETGRSGTDVSNVEPAAVADFAVAGLRTRGGGKPVAEDRPRFRVEQTLKICAYFCLWYAFNVVYNISNKEILNTLPLPWTTAGVQLGIGVLFVVPVWLFGLRKTPKMTRVEGTSILPIALLHTAGHIMTVMALCASSVSFVHIVKALEVVFFTVVSSVCFKVVFPWQVHATLVPIVCGVAAASIVDVSFSWVSLFSAMASNLVFSLRSIWSKDVMKNPAGKNMSPPNLYAVITIMSFLVAFPLAGLMEGPRVIEGFQKAISTMEGPKPLWITFLVSGLSCHLYNEAAFLALNAVHPTTHVVVNTIKRLVIMSATGAYFRTPMRPMVVGSLSMAIFGTLLYSLAMAYFPRDKACATG